MDHLALALVALLILPFAALAALVILSRLTPWPRRSARYFTSHTRRQLYSPRPSASDGSPPSSQPEPTAPQSDFPALLEWGDEEDRPVRTQPSLYLSVVVPCKNESRRLPQMLDECVDYLESRRNEDERFTYELIVVDDGSGDDTAGVAFAYSKRCPELRVLRLECNMGKGGAVREGMLCARGMLMLFADADGATRFADFARLEGEAWRLCNGGPPWSGTKPTRSTSDAAAAIDWTHPAMVVGSRAHLEEASKASRSFMRTFLMIGFHLLVRLFAVRSIRDTQCGFKLFTRAAAAKLFPRLHVERWAFDVELLYLAERLNYSLKEVAVEWKEIGGSQLTPFFSWIEMGRDILLIWFRYTISRQWTINDFHE